MHEQAGTARPGGAGDRIILAPFDLDAEGAVLSDLLLNPADLDRVAGWLLPEYFYSDANRRVLEALLGLRSAQRAIDVVTVATWLKDRRWLDQVGGTPYLFLLTDATPAVAHVEEHALIVQEKWRQRHAHHLFEQLAVEARQPMPLEAVGPFLERAEREVGRLVGLAHVLAEKKAAE